MSQDNVPDQIKIILTVIFFDKSYSYEKGNVTLVSLWTSRKEHPFLHGFFYSTYSGMHYINVLRNNGFKTSIVNQAIDIF